MTQQLGLLDLFDPTATDDATAVVEVPPSPPPQRTRPQRQAAPKKTTKRSTRKPVIQVKGKRRTHRWVSVSAEHGRWEHTVTYTVLPLAPGSHTPSEPCSSCGARRFRTYYWVANRHHDERGHPPTSDHHWACARCTSSVPESRVAEYTLPTPEE